jgi:L-lactate permease
MSFLTPEFLSLIGGSLVGFLFRYSAEKRQNDKELFERLIASNKQTTENQDKAAARVPVDIGRGIRQLIVLTVLFATLVAPFILPFFGVPTFIEVDQVNPESLLGVIPEYTKKFFVEVNGFIYTSENRQILVSIIGFYFGSAAAANKS